MMPPAQLPFAAFGAVWYGGLWCGLCRALATPWLDPWWLARGMQVERLRSSPRAAAAAPTEKSSKPIAETQAEKPAVDATIIPFDFARARAATSRAAANQGQPR